MGDDEDWADDGWADDESFMDIIAATSLGQQHESVFARLGQPYLLAMLNGQAFEAMCRLAEPALRAPLDDDEKAQEIVARGQGRRLHNAIGALIKAADGVLPDDLIDDLRRARERRNALAHDMLWMAREVIAGRGEQLIEALEADAEEFARLCRAVTPLVLMPAVEARGIPQGEMQQLLDAMGAALTLFPELFDGIDLKRPDVDDLLDRFEQLADVDPDEVARRLGRDVPPTS